MMLSFLLCYHRSEWKTGGPPEQERPARLMLPSKWVHWVAGGGMNQETFNQQAQETCVCSTIEAAGRVFDGETRRKRSGDQARSRPGLWIEVALWGSVADRRIAWSACACQTARCLAVSVRRLVMRVMTTGFMNPPGVNWLNSDHLRHFAHR